MERAKSLFSTGIRRINKVMMKYIFGVLLAIALVAIGVAGFNHPGKSKAPVASHNSYVALGDSIAAGVGLENYSDSSACDRTNQSYPNLVAHSLNLKLINLACSGATLPLGILDKQDVNQLAVSSQLDQLFSQPRPDLITLTVGANDIEWTTFIEKCYTGECGNADDSATVNELLATLSINLQNSLSQIQSHYKTAVPRVILTGYHQVFPAGTATCSDLNGIDPSELAWGRQQQASLNNTISTVASMYSFARYAPINFSGHELCTADSWVQRISANDPYHPTDAGQAEYARQVINADKLFK